MTRPTSLWESLHTSGPLVDPELAGWYLLDFDLDFDVDLADLATFERVFTGP